jgi:hypothetical protein
MPNPKKKQSEKQENPIIKIIKDISDDATTIIKEGVEEVSKAIDNSIKQIQTNFEKNKLKMLKQDSTVKKLQEETLRKANKKAKKKMEQVESLAEKALEDVKKSRMETEQYLRENKALKEKVQNLESQNKKIRALLEELNVGVSDIKGDLSKLKEETLYVLILILEFEKAIREFIKTELKIHYNEQWWNMGIPTSIQNRADSRIKVNNQKLLSDKMKYLSYSDYTPIIVDKNNWKEIFSKKFPNKAFIESRMEIITKTRNLVFHGNEIDENLEKLKSYLKDLSKIIERVQD